MQAGNRSVATHGLQGMAPLAQPGHDVSMDLGQPANSITSGFFQTTRSRFAPPPSPRTHARTHTGLRAKGAHAQALHSMLAHVPAGNVMLSTAKLLVLFIRPPAEVLLMHSHEQISLG